MPRKLCPGTQVPSVSREPGHVDPDLSENNGGSDGADAWDLIQAFRRRRERGQLRLYLFIDRGDIGVHAVDPGKQELVVVIEVNR